MKNKLYHAYKQLVCPHYLELSNREMDLRHEEIMEAYNTLRENTLTCEILVPLPTLVDAKPVGFVLGINYPILVTNDNQDGLVDAIMDTEHPRVPFIIHRELHNNLRHRSMCARDYDNCIGNLYMPVNLSLSLNKPFLEEITRQTEAWDQLKYAARKWQDAYPQTGYAYEYKQVDTSKATHFGEGA